MTGVNRVARWQTRKRGEPIEYTVGRGVTVWAKYDRKAMMWYGYVINPRVDANPIYYCDGDWKDAVLGELRIRALAELGGVG